MITSLKFQDFRIFPSLDIAPLQRVNLIAGANNTGKTGILEGLYLLFVNDAGQLGQLPAVFRSSVSGVPNQLNSDDVATFWQTLFYDRQTGVPAFISAKTEESERLLCTLNDNTAIRLVYEQFDGNGQRVSPPASMGDDMGPTFIIQSNGSAQQAQLHLSRGRSMEIIPRTNPFATKLIVISTRLEHPTRDADLYNQVTLLEGGEEKLFKLLQEIDPRLQKLRYLKAPGTSQAQVYAYFGLKNALSITQTGQGFSKLFSLFCQMLVSKAEVLLIDEIENGLYYETLPQIWKGIATFAASEKIQVFATTHSRECIIAAHETIKALPSYDFALHRLQRVKDKLEVVTHDKGMLEVALKSGLEVR
jgi:predicted ATP-dependent endonuclease of OLD family